MTDAKSWIEERYEFVQQSKLRRWGDGDIHRLTNAIEAVLELHKAVFDIHDPDTKAYCHECGYRPCATVQAIEGAINGERG